MLNKEVLKKELLASPFLELATKSFKPTDEIIIVQIAGSTAAEIFTPSSDLDISILSFNSWDLDPEVRGTFQGQHLHWWVCPFDFHMIPYARPQYLSLFLTGAYYMSFKPENIIWVNPKYLKLIDFLQSTYKAQQIMLIYKLLEFYREDILIWKTFEQFPIKKTYTPLVDFYYEQNKLPRNTELLIKAKRSIKEKDIILTDGEQAEIRKALLWTAEYCENLDYDYKVCGLEWQIEADRIIKECKNNNE